MGQSRYGPLPRTRNWRRVVELLDRGSSVHTEDIALAALRAARAKISSQRNNPVLSHCISLLVQLPLAAKGNNLAEFLEELGIPRDASGSPANLLAGLSSHLSRFSFEKPHLSALSEIIPLAFKETFSRILSQPTLHLFGLSAEEIRSTLRRYSDGAGFAEGVSVFFGSFLRRSLLYFLSKEVGNHVGPAAGFEDAAALEQFEEATRKYCQERATILSEFAADWHGKHVWKGEHSEERVRGFVAVCLRKLLEELQVEDEPR